MTDLSPAVVRLNELAAEFSSLDPDTRRRIDAYAQRRVAEAYESAAKCFEVYANDQIGCIEHRWVTARKDVTECRTKSATWLDAASELRRAISPAKEEAK